GRRSQSRRAPLATRGERSGLPVSRGLGTRVPKDMTIGVAAWTRVGGRIGCMASPLMESILHERVLATRRASAVPESARRIVVTGMGIVAPSGIGADALWTALRRRESAVQPLTRFDVSRYPVRIAAEIPDFRPRQFMTVLKART